MIIFRIKEIRKKQKISLKRLSEITNISRPYLFDLEENRKFNPSINILFDISTALNVNIKDLFYTTFDIDILKEEMYKRINEFGFESEEVMEISKIIDLLIVVNMKEDKN